MGTFWLVLGGCGSAVLAAAFPNVGIGLLGVSLAFGLTLLTMAYASGQAGFDVSAGFASNGYGEHSPGGYGLVAALVCEVCTSSDQMGQFPPRINGHIPEWMMA